MKTIFLAATCAAALASASQAATIYSEDFTGQNGDGLVGTSGTYLSANGWTASAAGVVSGDRFSVSGEAFSGNDTNDIATWLSPIIDVSGFTALSLAMDFFETGDHEGPGCNCGVNVDFLNLTVLLDGIGTTFTNINGFGTGSFSLTGDLPDDGDFGSTSFTTLLADAGTLRIQVDMRNTAASEVMGFDNIVLTGDEVAAVPLPAGGVLLLSGLAGAAALRKRRDAV